MAKWKITYKRSTITFSVEVEALDEDTAVMRAGMKRADIFSMEAPFFQSGLDRRNPAKRWFPRERWTRESVERMD